MTNAQKRALDVLWPNYGIEYGQAELDLDEVFGRKAKHVMEIGFGNGELLVAMATAQPDTDFIGVEVHEPGVGHCLLAIEDRGLKNVRLICRDAVEVLKSQIADAALDAVHLFFPDPWPKKRHHKRRIVQPVFVELLRRKITVGGQLHWATDWDEYAAHIEATVLANKGFQHAPSPGDSRPVTKFEARGRGLGHRITEGFFLRV